MKQLKFQAVRDQIQIVANSEKCYFFAEWKSRLMAKNLNKIAKKCWRIPCSTPVDGQKDEHPATAKTTMLQPNWPKANGTTN